MRDDGAWDRVMVGEVVKRRQIFEYVWKGEPE